MYRKTRLAILYNLRKKAGPKIKYRHSYSNSTTQITIPGAPPLYYSRAAVLQLYRETTLPLRNLISGTVALLINLENTFYLYLEN
jgi:hypothetical protein